MHILVVDPNVAFGTLLSEELVQLGHSVDTAQSGEQAVAHARVNPPALVILDMALDMPDALTLAAALRHMDTRVRLMLIPLMGEDLDITDQSIAIQGILPKPFFLPELPDRIKAALEAPMQGSPQDGPDDSPVNGDEDAADTMVSVTDSLEDTQSPSEVGVTRGTAPSHILDHSWYQAHETQLRTLLDDLIFEIGADGAILTLDENLLIWVGDFDEGQAMSLTTVVIQGWRSSEEMARILGREQLQFEQSIAGGSYMLYAVGVTRYAILAVAMRGAGTLGIIRHRAREAAAHIADLLAVS